MGGGGGFGVGIGEAGRVDHEHGWTSWFACYYNGLQVLFPADPPEDPADIPE